MQMAVPEAFDLSQGNRRDARLYGLPPRQHQGFAWQCLVARRLIERGVRFVELIDTGSSGNWDSHGDMMDHAPAGQERRPADRRPAQRPEAARAARRNARRLDDRVRPHAVQQYRRTPRGASITTGRSVRGWPAPASRPASVHGETDEYGVRVAQDPVHVHDFHATILHLMG